jgi:hypothetical protein
VSGSATCDEFVDLAAAAALDVLDSDTKRWVEEHAARCPTCGNALHELREAAAVLGSAVPQVEPPAQLRARVLDAARQRPGAPGRWRLRPIQPGRIPARVSLAWVAVAASIALSIVSMARIASLQNQVSELQSIAAAESERAARYDHVVEVLASDRLAIKTLQPVAQTVSSRGMVYLDPSSGTGMVMCHNLPPLEPGHAWQVWFVRGTERVSGGMLWPDGYGNGYTLITVPQDLQSFDSIGLTDEPGNGGRGSAWPTTPRVIGTALKESSQ